MSRLLDEVLAAHGGLQRWQAVTALTVHGRFHGLLRSRFPGNKMANLTVRMQLAQQHVVIRGFPHENQQAVFDRGDVRIETPDGESIDVRRDARAAFNGLSGLRRNLYWDPLDATYFAGYALWNYLSTPLLLTCEGVTVTDGAPWTEAGEQWRRLEVSFPPDIHTHSRQQTFYVDASGLIRRHDYVAEPVGPWAHAAHYSVDHRHFAGLVFPARRRARPQGPGGRALPQPTLVALDIDQVEIET
jgi:hypothetical protein